MLLRAVGFTLTVCFALVALAAPASAQGDASVALAGHPIVGTWLLDPIPDDPGNSPSMTTIHGDGTLADLSIDGPGVGAWVPTGWRSADLTIHYRQVDEQGTVTGGALVRASVVAADDGRSFTGTYTIEFGSGVTGLPGEGQLGPAVLAGERLVAEPMGVPVGPWPPGSSGGGGGLSIGSATGELGRYLVGPDGRTLYVFLADTTPGSSACLDDCADVWPPLLSEQGGAVVAGPGVDGVFGTIERPDGALQVTYDGQPLYFYVGDRGPGETTGHGVGDIWFVASVDA
jgi:predicted lipoprotein with Yx(FWY)xxD motif